MKKIILFSFILFLVASHSFGKQVDAATAKIVAKNFLSSRVNGPMFARGSDLNLVMQGGESLKNTSPSSEEQVCFYVFNLSKGGGFIVVSGDDVAQPVLAYSGEKEFSQNIPPHVAAWLDFYKQEIRFAIDRQLPASAETAREWQNLLNGDNQPAVMKTARAAGPLLQTTWDQSPYYNAKCPYDNAHSDYTVTGCVATAMAQLMKFWNSPATGSGFHSYNSNSFGTLSADFGSTTYQWTSMPASINSQNDAIATLMYHCGVSVDMTYGVGSTGGSSAYVVASQSPVQNCAEYALKTYFGYNTALQGLMRDSYSLNDWSTMLKTELDASRPVLYAGIGSGGGHCFVCDGYDQNSFFHFNWGWSGSYNGYFQIDALNPGGVGTGGGTGGFNSSQQALFAVQPSNGGGGGGGQTAALQLFSAVTPSAASITYGASFTVNADIWNNSTTAFAGDFCAAIFDATSAFLDFVEIKTGMNLPAGYHYTNGLTFSNSGLLTMLPGTYAIGIYFRPTGQNWQLVANGNYTNYTQVTVVNTNDVALYQAMTVTPGTTLIQNQSVSVHLDILNGGSATFNGIFDVSLYNLDGSFAFTIMQKTGMSLPAGYHYTNGLTFTNSSLNIAPGNYLLALQHQPTGGNWELSGSQNYPNPILVTVQQGAIAPDPFEPNNTVAAATSLPVNFAGNIAAVNTPGANCHTGNDYDYYKINLPAGFSYSVTGRLDDSHSSGNGQSYTLDAVVSTSTDGTTWSNTYDDIIPGSIILNNGGMVYFFVAPKFSGSTGTYLLDLQVSKAPIGIAAIGQDLFKLYPNPANDYVVIESRNPDLSPESIRVVNSGGQEVLSQTPAPGQKLLKVSLGNLSPGMYFIWIKYHDGEVLKPVVVGR